MCEYIVRKGEVDALMIFANGWTKGEIMAQFVYQCSVRPHSALLTHSLNNSSNSLSAVISIDTWEEHHSNVNTINTLIINNISASKFLGTHQW